MTGRQLISNTPKSISLRLPLPMLNELRVLANKRDVPYQSLIKMFLHERIDQELRRDIPRETAQSDAA
jgi:predicted DNA binding CopG/RHH family protein